jgi:quercetin dioxygenase-like cupin family protein
MARAGQVIEGQMGFRLHLLRVDPDLLELEASATQAMPPPPAHFHPRQDERFEVLDGAVWTCIGDVERTYEAGERFDVPAGTPHQVSAQGPARMHWEIRPALRTAELFERLYAGQAGEGFLEEFADEIRLT